MAAKVANDIIGGAKRIEHHKIRVRIDWFQHPCKRLVNEFLSIIFILLHKLSEAIRVLERYNPRPDSNRIDTV